MNTTMQIYPPNLPEKIGFTLILDEAVKHTYTPYGEELLIEQRPAGSAADTNTINELTRNWLTVIEKQGVHPLKQLKDVREILSDARVQGAMLSLEAFPVVYENARLARLIKDFFRNDDIEAEALTPHLKRLIPLKSLEEEIKSVITDSGALRDDASPELQSIRKKMNRRKSQLRKTINRLMKKAREKGMSSDEGPTIRNGRMVLPIQAEYKRKVQGFVHDVSSSGQTVYIEPVEALNMNNEIRQFEAEEQREIERILRELTNHVRKNRDYIDQNTLFLAKIDVIAAKAKLTNKLEGQIPILAKKNYLSVKEAYN